MKNFFSNILMQAISPASFMKDAVTLRDQRLQNMTRVRYDFKKNEITETATMKYRDTISYTNDMTCDAYIKKHEDIAIDLLGDQLYELSANDNLLSKEEFNKKCTKYIEENKGKIRGIEAQQQLLRDAQVELKNTLQNVSDDRREALTLVTQIKIEQHNAKIDKLEKEKEGYERGIQVQQERIATRDVASIERIQLKAEELKQQIAVLKQQKEQGNLEPNSTRKVNIILLGNAMAMNDMCSKPWYLPEFHNMGYDTVIIDHAKNAKNVDDLVHGATKQIVELMKLGYKP